MASDQADGQREPLIVDTTSDVQWDDEADVVVVGYGGAGIVAALQAREDGAGVLAIDRFGGGGATQFSGGVIYAAGTRYQRQEGFDDTAEDMFRYLHAEGVPLSDETLRRYCEGSNADIEWLESHGIPYGGNAYLDKTAFPPDGYWLYYSGNENTAKFRDKAKPAPRGHRVQTPAAGGWLYYQKLREAADAAGVRVASHCWAERLIVDRSGAVIGVEIARLPEVHWQTHVRLASVINPWKPFNNTKAEAAIRDARALERAYGQVRRIRARGGIILASGGFIYNLEMLARYQPEVARSYQGLLRLGSLGCDGSGIRLGESVGGETDLMDRLFIGSPLSPPLSYVKGGILVNDRGERFVAEDAYHAEIGNETIRQPGCRSWLIMEARTFWAGIKESAFPGRGMFMTWGLPPLINAALGGTKRARSIEKLASKCGIDPAGLARTVSQFNASVRAGHADPIGKSPDKLHAIEQGAFYAINRSVDNYWSPTMAFTLGGLLADEQTGEVLSINGGVVPGLYAAGRAAVGICSLGYMSGLSIADTVFSGRRAGRHVAHRINQREI